MMKTFRLLLGFIIIFPMICPAQKKELLIIGAGHVISLQKALNVIYPDLQVKLMSE